MYQTMCAICSTSKLEGTRVIRSLHSVTVYLCVEVYQWSRLFSKQGKPHFFGLSYYKLKQFLRKVAEAAVCQNQDIIRNMSEEYELL